MKEQEVRKLGIDGSGDNCIIRISHKMLEKLGLATGEAVVLTLEEKKGIITLKRWRLENEL